jgi:hypothetical protein
MISSRISRAFVALLCAGTAALAASSPSLLARQSISTLSTSQIEAFKPFTFLASAAYCQPATTLAWDCGTNCEGVPGFEPVASGGDGDSVQFWFVGFLPSSKTVVVSHQGTDTSEMYVAGSWIRVFCSANNCLGLACL